MTSSLSSEEGNVGGHALRAREGDRHRGWEVRGEREGGAPSRAPELAWGPGLVGLGFEILVYMRIKACRVLIVLTLKLETAPKPDFGLKAFINLDLNPLHPKPQKRVGFSSVGFSFGLNRMNLHPKII